MTGRLRIGTRGSDLALWQARRVAALLTERCRVGCDLVVVQTSGDRDRSRSLHELPGSGFFTKELQEELKADRVDVVVHSLKDLPTDEPEGLVLGAILQREDPRELVLARPEAGGTGGMRLRPGAAIGTSSLRRAAQALALQPDTVIRALRGNVPTRLRKLREGAYDAIMLAAAGVDRLGLDLDGLTVWRADVDTLMPAPGQGALAIEVRANDHRTLDEVRKLNDELVAEATRAERLLLKGLGGGCHLPLGALANRSGSVIELRAVLGHLDEGLTRADLRRASAVGATAETAAAAALAQLGGSATA
ncbi:MAG: hydroxymethylbilane synthase [Acidobacteria bacterium]|nr:hydroxymethylbilane synthase [Acidobacteriota bacterium]